MATSLLLFFLQKYIFLSYKHLYILQFLVELTRMNALLVLFTIGLTIVGI